MSASDDPQRCRALTKEGTQCSRDAVDGRFCHQHDENDPTIDDEDATDQEMNEQVEDTADQDDGETDTGAQDTSSLSSAANETTEESGGDEESEAEATDDESDAPEADAAESGGAEAEAEADGESGAEDGAEADASESSAGGVMEVRDTVKSVASELVGFPLDGVIEITPREEGWTAVIEVIERRSVPDTQDILGRYEITLEDADTITGYHRTGRHRRSDTGDDIRE